MASAATRPRRARLTRSSPHREAGQSEAGFKLGPVFESSFRAASGAAAIAAAALALIAIAADANGLATRESPRLIPQMPWRASR